MPQIVKRKGRVAELRDPVIGVRRAVGYIGRQERVVVL